MRTLAIVPVKRFAAAKARLAPGLEPPPRRLLAEAMLGDVLEALGRVRGLSEIAVVTAEPAARTAAAARELLTLDDPDEAGQSAAAAIGLAHARREGFERALLVPGDTPLLDPDEVDRLLTDAQADGVAAVIVPDRHDEGTNALLLTPPDALRPSFGPGSLERHLEAARGTEREHRVERPPSLGLDVDTPDDLEALRVVLADRPAAAPLTRTALAAVRAVPAEGAARDEVEV